MYIKSSLQKFYHHYILVDLLNLIFSPQLEWFFGCFPFCFSELEVSAHATLCGLKALWFSSLPLLGMGPLSLGF